MLVSSRSERPYLEAGIPAKNDFCCELALILLKNWAPARLPLSSGRILPISRFQIASKSV